MKSLRASRAAAIAAFLLATALLAGAVYATAWRAALDQAAERGRSDLALAADRLTGQLQRYREMAVIVANHPAVSPMPQSPPVRAKAAELMLTMADMTGAAMLQLVDDTRAVRAEGNRSASQPPDARVPDGMQPALTRALNGALGTAHFVGPEGRRLFAFAAPVFATGGPAIGAVLAYVDIAGIEWNWPADDVAVFFTDANGVIYVTNRSDLILRQTGVDFAPVSAQITGAHEVWTLAAGRYLPARALHLVQDMPIVGLRGELLLDLAPARHVALLQAAAVAAICLAFGAFLFLATERRRTLARLNATLERRVAQRTTALRTANSELHHEITERKQAEAQLQRAQAELVQAGKLSALGQMSAGISHELNQPLMAIRSFAENGALFLERNQPERAAENLTRISDLARRMGRIIQNLRAFARQEKESISDVDLVQVVAAVLEMAQGTIVRAGVTLHWQAPDAPMMVRGGDVRLQQVVMNLISNAIDAMDGSEIKELTLEISRTAARVNLFVRDTGPGIIDPSKMFDPFYSTKEVGASEGMGLGLSISYGLVQSFGGAIKGQNRAEGGAEFVLELASGTMAQAAA